MDKETLLDPEEKFWKEGTETYAASVAEEALFVLPEPAGVLSKQQCVEAIRQSPRWASVQFDDVRLIELDGTTTMLVYKALGKLGDGTAYAVLASSSYLVRDGSLLLGFRQQTPT